MTAKVALVGTFEVANYGDLLFPLITQHQLSARRDDLEFIWFGPVGGYSTGWPTVVGLGPFAPDQVARFAEMCDVAVIGGGELVLNTPDNVAPSYGLGPRDGASWKPSAWFSAPGLMSKHGLTVLWNAIGVAEPVSPAMVEDVAYVSVRDGFSIRNLGLDDSEADTHLVPDLAFLMDELFTKSRLTQIHDDLVDSDRLPRRPYVAIQASRWLASRLDIDELQRVVGDRDVVALVIGACHGDASGVELVSRAFGERGHSLPHPARLEEVAATIAHASAFLGNSLHGGITSLTYGTPFGLFDIDGSSKREGILEAAGVPLDHLIRRPDRIPRALVSELPSWERRTAVRARLAEHFDAISTRLPSSTRARDLRWDDHPAILHLALERPPWETEFSTDLDLTPSQPPVPSKQIGKAVQRLGSLRDLRRDTSDPARLISEALERHPPAYLEDWRNLASEVRHHRQSLEELRISLASTTSGWEETAAEVRRLESALSQRQAKLATLEHRAQSLERQAQSFETHLVSLPQSWLAAVSGPEVTGGSPMHSPYGEQYVAWLDLVVSTEEEPKPEVRSDTQFSVLTPVFNPSASALTECIRSVRSQTYSNWELVIVDVSDAPHVAPIIDRFTQVDSRIIVVKATNDGISENTNRAAREAHGDWFILLDHDDEIAPHALESVARAIGDRPEVEFVYSDEDKIDEDGNRSDPFFKPNWSPDLLRHVNYVTHMQAIRRDLWENLGGLRKEYDGAQDYDLALRASHQTGGALHIPDILYHWRTHDASTARDVRVKPQAHRAGRRALEDFVSEHVSGGWVDFGTGPTSHRIRYPVSRQLLSIIIPFRDNWELTEVCLSGIARTGTELPLEALLIDNQSSDSTTHAMIEQWTKRYSWIRVLGYDAPFNFQRLNNWAVEQASGDLLLFLNNDVEPIHEGWVEALAEHAQRPEVGAVGPRLFYPNGLVQHAGIVVGIGGYADHPWAGLHPETWTPAGPSYWTRNFLALTAACLMVERHKFESVGGFDTRFVVGGGDVALGIALHRAGLSNVYTPFARLIHHESATRGSFVPESDLEVSRQVYEPYLDGRDPFYNPNMSLADTQCGIRLVGRDGIAPHGEIAPVGFALE